MKRLLDVTFAAVALIALAPLLLTAGALIWLTDFRSPIYPGVRVGRNGRPFRIAKLRTMVPDAERTGVLSTAADDQRVTAIGRVLRRLKIDELPQLWSILKGDMALVGPRPNVSKEVGLYSEEERVLLTIRPGLTDYASIVFSDLATILHGSTDPNLDYRRLIRPWKSRLGLHYVRTRGLATDLALIVLTAVCLVSPALARRGVQGLLRRTGARADLIRVAGRADPLVPSLPPGVTELSWGSHLNYS